MERIEVEVNPAKMDQDDVSALVSIFEEYGIAAVPVGQRLTKHPITMS
jgi:hypothetical protein